MLGSSEKVRTFMEGFYRENKKAANKFVATVKEIFYRIQKFFESFANQKSVSPEAAKIAEASAEEIATIRKLFEAGLIGAREGNAARNSSISTLDTKSATNAQIVLRQERVIFDYGATQEAINEYVDAAYTMQNVEDYKKYANPSSRLISDVSNEIDINGYAHAIRDNDIRHIRNSHGENTPEKYPVTKEDIKVIPWIVENYDKVLVVKRKDGRTGIIYVKVKDDGLVYYLEQATRSYGNEPLLINKQMIKTGIGDIPDIKGLRDAITKKESEAEFLNDLRKVHQVYVQDVYQLHSKNIVSQPTEIVKGDSENISDEMKQSRFDEGVLAMREGNAARNADNLQKTAKSAEKDGEASIRTTGEAEVMHSLRVVDYRGTAKIVSPYDITREDLKQFIKLSFEGKLKKKSYFPISDHTPKTILYTLRNVGIQVYDRPIAMQVKKARQAQEYGEVKKGDGTIIRKHKMSVGEILEVIDKIENPTNIIQERFRKKEVVDQNGNTIVVSDLDRFVVFVELDSGDEAVAVLEFNSTIDPNYLFKDGKGDKYHTTVTIFKPDVVRNGEKFDYFLYLIDDIKNKEMEIVKKSPSAETANIENLDTETANGLSEFIVSQNSEKSSGSEDFSFTEEDFLIHDEVLHQRRIETPAPSELLGELFRSQEAYKNYGQYTESLKKYKDLLVRVGNQEKRIGEIDAEIEKLKADKNQSGKGARMNELYRMRQTAERKIAEYRNRMFAMEAKELRSIVEKETQRAVAEAQRRDFEKYTQKSKERTERLKMSERRAKLKKIVKELDRLLNRGTKEKHVKEELRETVGSALKLAEVLFTDELTNADIVLVDDVQSYTEAERQHLQEYRRLLELKEKLETELGERQDNAPKDETFAQQVDDVLSGKDTVNTHLRVMETPPILLQAGLSRLPILMTSNHLRSITGNSNKKGVNNHKLSPEDVKQLPELLSDPVMIMDSLTRDDSIVVLTEAHDEDGNPIIAAIKLNGRGNENEIEIDANILTSAYGKENFQSFIERNLNEDTVFYWNEKKTQALFDTPGLQLPDNIKRLASDTIIRQARAFVKMKDEKSFKDTHDYNTIKSTLDSSPQNRYNDSITEDEEAALLAYKSGGSYTINAKLREGMPLNEYEQNIVDHLDSALPKLPTYKGKVYRNIVFDGWGDQAARDAYVKSHGIGETISYGAYTSTSTATDGYILEGEYVVHHIIQSRQGRNLEGHGNNFESEVLFSRETQYVTERIEYDKNGTPTIYLTEEAYERQENQTQTADGRGTGGTISRDHSGESRSPDIETDQGKVQRLYTSDSKNIEMQSLVSERNSKRNILKQGDLRELQGKVNDVATLLTEEAYERQENQTQTADGRGTGGTISRDHSGESRSPDTETDTGKVQRLHSQNTQNSKMPVAVSGRNTVGNRAKQEELRGVRGEVSKSSSNDRVQAELKRIDRKISTLDRELKNLFEREKNRYNRVSMDVVIGELETAYRSLKNAEDDFIRQAYDEGVAERIETVKEEGIIQNKKAVDYHRFLFNTLPYCRLSIQD